MNFHRFATTSTVTIDQITSENENRNTKRTKNTAWKMFMDFCNDRSYELLPTTTPERLDTILKDFAFNMRKTDGTDYKECTIKTLWNLTAKLLMDKYWNEFKVSSKVGTNFSRIKILNYILDKNQSIYGCGISRSKES